MKPVAEFYAKKNGGKSPRESTADGELISPIYACILMEEYASLRTSKLEKDLKDAEAMFEKMELTAFNFEKRIKKLKELVGVYKKYAELLAESEGNLAAFAHTHRVTVDEKIVKKGIELRKQISELRKELGI